LFSDSTHGSPLPNADSEPSANSPDLSTMLKAFSGGLNIHSLLKYVKDLKVSGDLLKEVTKTSPLLKGIFDTIGKRNVEMRVLMKITEGKLPDLSDLYQLATGKSDNMFTDGAEISSQNSQWMEIQSDLLHGPASQKKAVKVFELYTGRKVKLDPDSLVDLNGGKYTVSKQSRQERNYIELYLFMKDNFGLMLTLLEPLVTDPINVQGIMDIAKKMDFTHFAQIQLTTQAGQSSDVSAILQNVKENTTDQSQGTCMYSCILSL